MKTINWKRIIEKVLDPLKEDRELWEKEKLKRVVQTNYGVNISRAIEARKREHKVTA